MEFSCEIGRIKTNKYKILGMHITLAGNKGERNIYWTLHLNKLKQQM